MKLSPDTAADSRESRWCVTLFAVVLGLHLWCAHLGWANLPLDGHEFRQTQTALSVRYLVQDGLRLDYPTPLLGKPWSIPLEFPLYQVGAAVVSRTTGLPVEQAARVVGLAFFYLTLPALYLLAGRLALPPGRRLLILAAVLASPLYLFYSRAVMIESTGLCLSAWFLWAYWRTLVTGGWAPALAALGCGSLAAMVKLPSLMVFLPPAVLIFRREHGRSRTVAGRPLLSAGQQLVVALLLCGGAVSAGLAWSAHADTVKSLNPLAGFLQSAAVGAWGFGGIGLRFTAGFWFGVGSVVGTSVLGTVGLTTLGIFWLMAESARRRLILVLVGCVLPGPLVFSTLYQLHDYYYFAPGIFLLGAFGLALGQVLDTAVLARPARWLIVTAALGAGFLNYAQTYYRLIPANESRVPELSRALKAITARDDVLVIYGQDWNPVLPYMAERRALMIPTRLEADSAAQEQAFARLAGERVGALVVVGPLGDRRELIQPLTQRFGLASDPLLTGNHTQVFVPAASAAAAVAVLRNLGLHDYQIDSRGGRVLVASLPAAARTVFSMMTPMPREAATQFGLGTLGLDGKEVFGAHPVTELVFSPPSGVRRLRAGFGLLPPAYADPQKGTDGVLFEVLLQEANGAVRPLAQRLLTPLSEETDRGPQEFDLELPDGPGYEIILRTGPGKADNFSFDWAYWSFVTLK